jgi:hypothetical protein
VSASNEGGPPLVWRSRIIVEQRIASTSKFFSLLHYPRTTQELWIFPFMYCACRKSRTAFEHEHCPLYVEPQSGLKHASPTVGRALVKRFDRVPPSPTASPCVRCHRSIAGRAGIPKTSSLLRAPRKTNAAAGKDSVTKQELLGVCKEFVNTTITRNKSSRETVGKGSLLANLKEKGKHEEAIYSTDDE